MLCFRCGSYNPENAQKCTVCGQGFIDEAGKAVGPPRRVSQTALPASIFVPGETVAGRYKIGELLGQGGVGAVYRARDTEIDVDVALKAITSNLLQTEEEQKNFSKQIKGARKLQHPNIVRIYDEGHEGNRRFFTMKLLEGLTLRKIIRLRHEKGQPFSAEELVPIFHQLAAALEYAHKTTWHGDLKPENIIILPDLLKVTDFNLVKALPLKPFLGIAKSRSKGFPYIAPELRVEANTIDGRVDIYALGVILAEMLTGLVFEGHYSRAMTAALEQLPTKLDGLVRKAVTEHPDGRFLRATDLARDLETALGAMTGPLPPPAKPAAPATLANVSMPQVGAQAIVAPPRNPLGAPPHPSQPATIQPPRVVEPAHHTQPPPPPEETGPSHSPAPQLSSEDPDADRGTSLPSEIVEIGQSQVLLLQSGAFSIDDNLLPSAMQPVTAPPGALADAARRLMAVTSSPSADDTLDEPPQGSDMETAPRGAPLPREIPVEPSRKKGASSPKKGGAKIDEVLAGNDLARKVWDNDESKDDGLIPPPLPDDQLERSMDAPVQLPGDDDPDEDEPTDEREVIAPRGVDDPIADSKSPPINAASEIHDALTALKPHPAELMDADRRPAGIENAETGLLQPPPTVGAKPSQMGNLVATGDVAGERTDKLNRDRKNAQANARAAQQRIDEEPEKDTLSVDELRAAGERSSPRLHRAEALPPPVIAPPPVLRPVSPPRRSGGGSGTLALGAILGIVILAVAVVVWRFVLTDGGAPRQVNGNGTDQASVITREPGDDALVIPVGGADAGVVDHEGSLEAAIVKTPETPIKTPEVKTPVIDAGVTVAIKTPETPEVKTPDPPEAKGVDAGVVIAMASGTCPKGMAFVESGSFTFGSSSSDNMRNFGEADAAPAQLGGYCVDYYEQPNGKDSLPTTGVSWQAAKTACERLGRRLCSEKEWERACKGPASNKFPYGNAYDSEVCNTEDGAGAARALAPATAFKKCRSGYKAFMMAGNAEEWVLDSVGGQKIAKGGAADRPDFASRCSARRALAARTTSSTLGFRCCADAK